MESPAFVDGQPIPWDFSGEGRDISPPLRWSNVPPGTREFALLCEDPDAKSTAPEPWVHWVIYHIPASVTQLPQGIPAVPRVEASVLADQGENSWERIGYGGPLPPPGDGPHQYLFKLYALDAELGLRPRAPRAALLDAMRGHVLEVAVLTGIYERRARRAA